MKFTRGNIQTNILNFYQYRKISGVLLTYFSNNHEYEVEKSFEVHTSISNFFLAKQIFG